MKIREIEDEDVNSVIEILRDEVYDGLSFKKMKEWFVDIGNFPYAQHFVAEKEEEIVGIISWILRDRYGKQAALDIQWMAIDEDYQKQGIGRQLVLDTLESVVFNWNKRGIMVTAVRVETDEENEGAQHFYSKVLKEIGEITALIEPCVWDETDSGKKGIVQYSVHIT